jgi:hypothetical protein
MIVTSSTNSAQVYANNKTTATKTTSAYESTTTTAQTQQTDTSKNSANVHNSEDYVIKEFLDDMYSKGSVSSASAITKETIQNKVNEYAQVLMESKGDAPKSESDISKILNEYKKELLQDYKKSLDGATNDNMTLEQQAIIKVLLEENTQEASALEQLLSQTASSTPKVTDKMAEMIEKYKDVYTPMPEKFSQEIEDLQTALIREKYPDYLPLEEVLKKYAVPVESPTPEAEAKAKTLQDAKIAESLKTEGPNYYNGGLPRDEEREAFIRSVMMAHPNNIQDKYFNLSNSSERARTLNAAIYEGLENGETLDEAKAKASQVMDTYLDNTEMVQKMVDRSKSFFHEYYEAMEKSTEESKKIMERDGILQLQKDDGSIKYDGTVLDLREYGFDRRIFTLTLSKNNKDMVSSLQEQIKFFDFILKNEELVKGKYDELDEEYKQRNSFNGTVMIPVKEAFPITQRALAVFSQYKIYDN